VGSVFVERDDEASEETEEGWSGADKDDGRDVLAVVLVSFVERLLVPACSATVKYF